MERALRELAEEQFDLVVVGGGIFGCCAAWEAAHRGLRTAVIEAGDFCRATSANHLKMVHGGIRYLQHCDLPRVWESARERSALLRICSHLVYPLRIAMPTYGHGLKGKELLRTGILVYDILTAGRNRGIADKKRQIPWGRSMGKHEVLAHFPGLPPEGLTGAGVFADAQMYNPPRLALAFLRSAVQAGASAANYVQGTEFLLRGDRVMGVRALDCLTGGEFEIKAKVVLNTAGPWAHLLTGRRKRTSLPFQPTFSRDTALVIRKQLSPRYALALPCGSKDADALLDRGGRHLFIAPWRDWTLVGVWHGVWRGTPDELIVTDQEIESYLAEANEVYPGFDLSESDVAFVNTGLILFGDAARQGQARYSFGKRSILVDHHRTHGLEGLLTLIGVRATTARGKAQKAVDRVFRKLGRDPTPSESQHKPLWGGDFEDFEELVARARRAAPDLKPECVHALVHNYGTEYRRVLRYREKGEAFRGVVGNTTVLAAEVSHAVREEMAVCLADIVFRRTDVATGGDPGEEALEQCAALAAQELKWSAGRLRSEYQQVRTILKQRGTRKCFRHSQAHITGSERGTKR